MEREVCDCKKGECCVCNDKCKYSHQICETEMGINAYPSGGQRFATKLTAKYNRIDFAENHGSSVMALRAKENLKQWIFNFSPNDIEVFPQIGEKFLNLAVDAPVVVPAGDKLFIICYKKEEGVWTDL